MSCSLKLNAKEKNRILYTLEPEKSPDLVDTTNYTITFRLKANIENTTAPLIEVNATKTLESTTKSTGYFDVDLSLTTPSTYLGIYYYEIEANDGVNPPVFWEISTLEIITRLDN
jgi:hypothetical protein